MILHKVLEKKGIVSSENISEDIFDMQQQTFIIPQSFSYKVVEVSKGMIGRPDLLSKYCYQNDIYADILCKLNGISNPFELNEGMLVIVPDLADLDKFMYIERPIESAATSEDGPKPKAKKDKRKANEAVIGDTRFKIDSNNKIIIY